MSRRYFGTDGIRGRVGEGVISADFVLRLGNAYGHVLRAAAESAAGPRGWRKPVVIIGKDTRISNYMFEAALEAGLVAAGVDVQLMGPMPTPAVAHLTHSMRADGGIVISASHNPHFDNGIKFFSAEGEKLDDATELAIENALDLPFSTVPSEQLGKAERTRDAIGRYVEACKNSVPKGFDLGGMRVVVDCANGAAYRLGPLVLAELGARVEAIGVDPNGLNINAGVGSTHPDNLASRVRETGADLGIAFDGDGDRVLFVDGDGAVRDGDDLLFVLASDWQATGRLRGPVVGTLMTNFGLEQALEHKGIGFIRAKVGDRHVHQQLLANDGVLGGEASGHILCLDRASTGDGIVSALQVLEVLKRRGISLREALSGMARVPQKTVNVRYSPGATRPTEAPAVQSALQVAQASVQGRGRAFLRPSGTEPVVRVTVEADDTALVEATLERLVAAVRDAAA
ncbi:phosphoglucosamine mutase [Lysobacter daejeonensis GH1-9]|uniref:Phosphoglucosamine mutase n=1 Tax=Lysobacter daejeonensis GH1-9 TaxID=1385517 RepID=A0A0A0F2K6_9GAMM|nr:phosphoglucosamine mutase [Lysobacter daejeonensis]KGM55632.1 phosphoglucosamine mutase [Lysobacter daejeonensis GH1-9]